MPRFLTSIISLLFVSCLIVNPAAAFPLHPNILSQRDVKRASKTSANESIWSTQAINVESIFGHPLLLRFKRIRTALSNAVRASYGFRRKRDSQSASLLIRRASKTRGHDELLVLVDHLASLNFDVDTKLEYAAQIFSTSPDFLGNHPPFFTPLPSQVLARHVFEMSCTRPVQRTPLVILSYGIADGRRLYEATMFCRALGVRSTRIIGIDYNDRIVMETRERFPSIELYDKDLLKWSEEDEIFSSLKGKVDVVDTSFLLHEIYSFGGLTHSESNRINHDQGVIEVRSLLDKTGKLLRPGGIMVVTDGTLLEKDDQRSRFKLSQVYAAVYRSLQQQYQAYSLPPILEELPTGEGIVELTQRELAIFLDKGTFFSWLRRRAMSSDRVEREMKERLQFWSENEWIQELTNAGLTPIFLGHYRHKTYYLRDRHNVKALGEAVEFPRPYSVYVAQKINGKAVALTRDDRKDMEVPLPIMTIEERSADRTLAPVLAGEGWPDVVRKTFEILQRIQHTTKRGMWLGIDGYSGSGKSSLVELLAQELKATGAHVVIVQVDWFLKPRSERDLVLMGGDDLLQKVGLHLKSYYRQEEMVARLRDLRVTMSHLEPGETATVVLKNMYDRQTGLCNKDIPLEISYGASVIVEGLGALDPLLAGGNGSRNLYDLTMATLLDETSQASRVIEREYEKPVVQRISPDILSRRVALIDYPLTRRHLSLIAPPDLILDSRLPHQPRLFLNPFSLEKWKIAHEDEAGPPSAARGSSTGRTEGVPKERELGPNTKQRVSLLQHWTNRFLTWLMNLIFSGREFGSIRLRGAA